jgi:DNA invertase Pin-like site-specific DNA recombinase
MQIGYARSSTIDQEAGYQAQIKTLTAAGCDKIFAEKVSSVAQRTELEAALDYAREGDALVVTKLDRLARSVSHLVAIGEKLDAKGVSLKVLEQAIDTSTPTGRLMFNMLGAIAQFERDLMLERQREGVAKAKVEGKYKGRAPTARAKAAEVRRLCVEGVGATEIARRLGIGRASVYRVLAAS